MAHQFLKWSFGGFSQIITKNGQQKPKLTDEEEKEFQDSKQCHICECVFKPTDTKCRDNDHLTGKYRGSAHYTCNLNWRLAPRGISYQYLKETFEE